MKKRVISGSVIVSGTPSRSWRWKSGTTLPEEPRTFPKRTATYRRPESRATAATASSASRFVAPMTELGATALSVETRTNRSTPAPSAARSAASVPPMFV